MLPTMINPPIKLRLMVPTVYRNCLQFEALRQRTFEERLDRFRAAEAARRVEDLASGAQVTP